MSGFGFRVSGFRFRVSFFVFLPPVSAGFHSTREVFNISQDVELGAVLWRVNECLIAGTKPRKIDRISPRFILKFPKTRRQLRGQGLSWSGAAPVAAPQAS